MKDYSNATCPQCEGVGFYWFRTRGLWRCKNGRCQYTCSLTSASRLRQPKLSLTAYHTVLRTLCSPDGASRNGIVKHTHHQLKTVSSILSRVRTLFFVNPSVYHAIGEHPTGRKGLPRTSARFPTVKLVVCSQCDTVMWGDTTGWYESNLKGEGRELADVLLDALLQPINIRAAA